VLVNYACHPAVLGRDNLEYSADYVGVMARTVEEAVGPGERMVDQSVMWIYDMLGRFADKPEDLK
jgi:hypothetical protein